MLLQQALRLVKWWARCGDGGLFKQPCHSKGERHRASPWCVVAECMALLGLMHCFLDTPAVCDTLQESQEEEDDVFKVGVSAMQGWRTEMVGVLSS